MASKRNIGGHLGCAVGTPAKRRRVAGLREGHCDETETQTRTSRARSDDSESVLLLDTGFPCPPETEAETELLPASEVAVQTTCLPRWKAGVIQKRKRLRITGKRPEGQASTKAVEPGVATVHRADLACNNSLDSEVLKHKMRETSSPQPGRSTTNLQKVAPQGPLLGIAVAPNRKELNLCVPQDNRLEDTETRGQPASFTADSLQRARDNDARDQPDAPAFPSHDAAVARLIQQVQGSVITTLPDERPKQHACSVASVMQHAQDSAARGTAETEHPKKDASLMERLIDQTKDDVAEIPSNVSKIWEGPSSQVAKTGDSGNVRSSHDMPESFSHLLENFTPHPKSYFVLEVETKAKIEERLPMTSAAPPSPTQLKPTARLRPTPSSSPPTMEISSDANDFPAPTPTRTTTTATACLKPRARLTPREQVYRLRGLQPQLHEAHHQDVKVSSDSSRMSHQASSSSSAVGEQREVVQQVLARSSENLLNHDVQLRSKSHAPPRRLQAPRMQDATKEPANAPKASFAEDRSFGSLGEHGQSWVRYVHNSQQVLLKPLLYQVVRSDPAHPRYAVVRKYPDDHAKEIARLDHGKFVYGFPGPRWVKLIPARVSDIEAGWALQGRQLVVQCLKLSGFRNGCKLEAEWEGIAAKGCHPTVVQYDLAWQPKQGTREDNWRTVKIVDDTKVSVDDVPETGLLELRVIALINPAQVNTFKKFPVFGPRMKVAQGRFGCTTDVNESVDRVSPPGEGPSAYSTMKVEHRLAVCKQRPVSEIEPSLTWEDRTDASMTAATEDITIPTIHWKVHPKETEKSQGRLGTHSVLSIPKPMMWAGALPGWLNQGKSSETLGALKPVPKSSIIRPLLPVPKSWLMKAKASDTFRSTGSSEQPRGGGGGGAYV